MPFGQIVIGPPGSGKTTYCNGMHHTWTQNGCVNLDPANDCMTYESHTLDDAMEAYQLGPNGGMNIQWLVDQLASHPDCYFIFDCPGQVELYTHNQAIKNIVRRLEKHDFRLACVHLAARFISVLMLSLTTMTMLEMPHINVLSKIDLLEQMGELDFNLEYYTSVMDLSYLLFHLNERETSARFSSLNQVICELIEDYSLVGFSTLCINDKHSVAALLKEIDKANGYIFGALTEGNESILMAADSTDLLLEARDAQARYSAMRLASAGDDDDALERPAGLLSLVDNLSIVEHQTEQQ
ncbi:hypothetical protein BX661DRAFT_187467 [Kickxella alabastrina]|uniref:uncharacterized protein n=1 Tax=Kickxella alabastrina TaxID=61397 RepID=UPI00222067C8|nr:uncharacterized protein BX661DRAFT_187467 [Kickxella alabastrina]KAI7822483.1 hypothetical protein BX661DRAFT_187467 [Kickxella alabastrina]